MIHHLKPALQVIDYVRRLAPEPRRAIRIALKELSHDRGDIKALEGTLSGYDRLRVGRHRIIFGYPEEKTIEAVFIEERSLVYEVFEAEFVKKLRRP